MVSSFRQSMTQKSLHNQCEGKVGLRACPWKLLGHGSRPVPCWGLSAVCRDRACHGPKRHGIEWNVFPDVNVHCCLARWVQSQARVSMWNVHILAPKVKGSRPWPRDWWSALFGDMDAQDAMKAATYHRRNGFQPFLLLSFMIKNGI